MVSDHGPTFRTAIPADAEAIGALVRDAYAKWVPVIGREPRPMTADYADSLKKHRIDLAEMAGRLAGLIETDLRDDHLWIENVAVAPDWQGRGIGRALLDRADDLARANGRAEVRLLTNAAFESNVALYQGLGYVTTMSEPFMGGTTLHMSKVLGAR